MKSHLLRFVSLLLLCVLALPAHAQFRVEVTGVGLTQLPISVSVFQGEEQAGQALSSIILADLERSGQFRGINAGALKLDERSIPDLSIFRQAGADSMVAGSVTKLADGRFDVRFRLWDVVKGQDYGGQSFAVAPGDLRLAAHRAADYIHEKLTGDKGVFSTRIAYVTKDRGRFQLWVADSDGENAQSALSSPEPIISPAWSPDGNQLAYVSFESRKPVVYVHSVSTGKRRLIANFKGSNSAPAWSPDGKSLAVTLSREGGSQLFVLPSAGGEAVRLTESRGIDTEPTYSADGKFIYFVSDRGGSPQIYRMRVDGQGLERVTFNSAYSISPTLSPDGRWLAYVARIDGVFRLQVMELSSGTVRSITQTTADESPSFAPNSKLIVYATVQQGVQVLMTTTLDGRVKARLGGRSGDVREPDWGPFFN